MAMPAGAFQRDEMPSKPPARLVPARGLQPFLDDAEKLSRKGWLVRDNDIGNT
jgi:hypothetical protein